MDPMRFDDQVVLITGAGQGLGRTYARLLGQHGARLLLTDRPADAERGDSGAEVAAEIRAAGGIAAAHAADISTSDGARSVVDAALGEFGRLDAVINNAGILRPHPFPDYPLEQMDAMLAVHARAPWAVTQAAWPALERSGHGRVVNTVSRAVFFGEPNDVAYSMAKSALYGLTRSLALVGEPSGIKVNAICPVAWTPMFASAREMTSDERALLQRRYDVDNVAPVVGLLAHERCPCNGEVLAAVGANIKRYYAAETPGITVDGGWSVGQLLDEFANVFDADDATPIALANYKDGETS